MIGTLRERRSIRKFIDQKIEPEKAAILQEIVLRSPSGKNSAPLEFVFIDNPEIIRSLKNSRPNSTKALETSPLAVAVCADESKTDTWIEDCSIAAVILQITAQSLGLGSCWIQIRNRFADDKKLSEDFVRELLGIPAKFRIQCLIAVGYPGEIKEPKPADGLLFDKIRWNGF
jgi:nitroreductase